MSEKKNAFAWFFVGILWRTFCVNMVWNTFCKKWIWRGFFVNQVYKKFDKWKGWIYLSPALILLAVFTVWPIINTVRIAFLEKYYTLGEVGGRVFEFGLYNFEKVIGYTRFWDYMRNTMLLTVITVPLSTFIALLIAVCLNSIKWFNRLLQTIYFLPYVTNSIAIGMVFAAMFNVSRDGNGAYESIGIMNNILGWFNIAPIDWINGTSTWATATTAPPSIPAPMLRQRQR